MSDVWVLCPSDLISPEKKIFILNVYFLMQTQSLPVPHPAVAAEAQVRSMSPGGFDSFTLDAEIPSLHMLSPQSQQTPLFSRHAQQPGGGAQHTPLSLQSFDSALGAAQSRQLSSGSPGAGMAYYPNLTGLQPGASSSELQSTPEHEQLRSGQVRHHCTMLPSTVPAVYLTRCVQLWSLCVPRMARVEGQKTA